MTQRIKILGIFLLVTALIHCERGPNGRRIYGYGYGRRPVVQAAPSTTTQAQIQTQALASQTPQNNNTDNTTDTTNTAQKVDTSNIPDWDTLCDNLITDLQKNPKLTDDQKAGLQSLLDGTDTDGDGIPDYCETYLHDQNKLEYAALDPNVYNGVLIGGRIFDPKDMRLVLSGRESEIWLKVKNELGGLGGAINSSLDSKITKKFIVNSYLSKDSIALKDLFYDYGAAAFPIHNNYHSYDRSYLFQNGAFDDDNLALARGDHAETVPFSPSLEGNTIADLTGISIGTTTLREKDEFLYVIEGNIYVPNNGDGLQIKIGYREHEDGTISGPEAGMFFVFVNGESEIVNMHLINDHGGVFDGSHKRLLRRMPGCLTSHVVIAYFSNEENYKHDALFAESVFYRWNDNDTWKPFHQGMLSLQPMGGKKCYQTFNSHDPDHKNTFFNTSSGITSRVRDVVDFNTSLSPDGISDPNKFLDDNSQSIGFLAAAKSQIPHMNREKLTEFEKSFSQIDPSTLTPDTPEKPGEPTLYNDLQKLIDAREKSLPEEEAKKVQDKAKEAIDNQFVQLDQLIQGMDPTSTDFPSTVDQIKNLFIALNKNPDLTDDQKKKIKELINKFNANAKTTVATDPKAIQLIDDGAITLTWDQLFNLKSLGFTILNPDQTLWDYVAEKKKKNDKKISEKQMDNILTQLNQKFDSGDSNAKESKDIIAFFKSIRNKPGVNQDTVNDFLGAHGDESSPKATIKWTDEQIKYLQSLPTSEIKPKFGATRLKTWSSGFADQPTSDLAKEDALTYIENALFDPQTRASVTHTQRMTVANALKGNGFISDDKYNELLIKIEAFEKDLFKSGVNPSDFKIVRINGRRMYKFTSKIAFPKGTNQIDINGQNVLRQAEGLIIDILKVKPEEIHMRIVAYTSSEGGTTTNVLLSQARAMAVKDYYSGKSESGRFDFKLRKVVGKFPIDQPDNLPIPEANMPFEGRGSKNLIRNKNGSENQKLSRRVEIFFDSQQVDVVPAE